MTITYKFVLEIKGQCRIGIMNVRDTSSHGDRRMCQIWLSNVKTKKVELLSSEGFFSVPHLL